MKRAVITLLSLEYHRCMCWAFVIIILAGATCVRSVLKRPRVLSGPPGTDRVAATVDVDGLFLPVSRSMAKSCPRPPTTRRWRLSAPPRSPSWSRFCAEARLLTPRSQTSAPRPTSPFSTSRLSQTCLPPHPRYRSWRSICSLRSESLLKRT